MISLIFGVLIPTVILLIKRPQRHYYQLTYKTVSNPHHQWLMSQVIIAHSILQVKVFHSQNFCSKSSLMILELIDVCQHQNHISTNDKMRTINLIRQHVTGIRPRQGLASWIVVLLPSKDEPSSWSIIHNGLLNLTSGLTWILADLIPI